MDSSIGIVAPTRAFETGWITASAPVLPNHNPVNTNDCFPTGQPSANNIKPNDLLFAYRTNPRLGVTRHGTNGSHRSVFACVNNMDRNQEISFVGVATTSSLHGSIDNSIVSMTMAGTVTVDHYSCDSFKDGDLVAWKLPEDKIPVNSYDRSCGRIRPILYPVRISKRGRSVSSMTHHLSDQTDSIIAEVKDLKDSSGGGGGDKVADILISMCDDEHCKSEVVKVLTEGSGPAPINLEALEEAFRKDIHAVLCAIMFVPDSGSAGDLKHDHGIKCVVLCALALKAKVREWLQAVKQFKYQGKLVENDMVGMLVDARVTECVSGFMNCLQNDMDLFRQHHIIGTAIRSASLTSNAGLDIWIGKKA